MKTQDELAAEEYLNQPYVFLGSEQEKLISAFLAGIEHERTRAKELVEALEKAHNILDQLHSSTGAQIADDAAFDLERALTRFRGTP